MSLPIAKNISASAGTGKTYRLSLEYLALLLEYFDNPEFKPEQILVITFTRKATAEIRARIYLHLQTIAEKAEGWQDVCTNLKSLTPNSEPIDAANPLSEAEFNLLNKAYRYLLIHKEQLQVMTIDSYIHSIFRNLVRPVRGIDRFELDLKAVEKQMPYLFNELMRPAIRVRIESLLSRKLKPALDEYESFFRSLIDNRWLYYLARIRAVETEKNTLAYYTNHPEEWVSRAEEHQTSFLVVYCRFFDEFVVYLQTKYNLVNCDEAITAGLLNKDFAQLFSPMPDSIAQLKGELQTRLGDASFAQKILKLLADGKYFWNGTKIRSTKNTPEVDSWKAWHQQAGMHLANHLIFRLFLPEQIEILNAWSDVLHHYDKLIYRYKNFTYDDIAWFTFEALYSSFPPLFKAEDEEVANEFYDFMSRRTRFMLIDEFQDTSILQFNILKPMIEEIVSGEGTKPYGGFIVVGDEKQSIFGWRGGQRDLLLNMERIFPSMVVTNRVALTDSWRSSPRLMDFINGVFNDPGMHDYLLSTDAAWKYTDITGQKKELDDDTVVRFQLRNYSNRKVNENLASALRDFVENTVVPAVLADPSSTRSIAVLARKNDELELIRALLAEHGIAGEFQSSKSLTEHPVIKAMLFLLRFNVYQDWYDFLAFLRSDILLMNGADLKRTIDIISAYQQNKSPDKPEIDFTTQPVAEAVYLLSRRLDTNQIRYSCLLIMQECQIPQKLTLERDFINLQRFLDIAQQYETNFQSSLPRLQGFLRYCTENSTQEIFQQQDVESSSAIQLLTIHKSKGLEFDTVFVWWNLKSFHEHADSRLKGYVDYADAGYHNLKDIAITLHYKKILAASSFRDIMLMDEQRMQLEELNNLYVALTRAKNQLYIYTVFSKKGGWQEYLESYEKADKLAPQHYATIAILNYMQEHSESLGNDTWQIGNPLHKFALALVPDEDKTDTAMEQTSKQLMSTDSISEKLKQILPDWQHPVAYYQNTDEPDTDIDWKESFLTRRENLKGNIAHYYLAQIKYAGERELETARILTRRQFGNLMSKPELEVLIDSLETQLSPMKDIFSSQYDIVFTEFAIYQNGKEYRIDRLMINTNACTYRLVDYKTGGIYHQEQLAFYAKLVQALLTDKFSPACAPEYISIGLP